MRPHPKLRKTIKWGGAAVTMLLVVVWIGSGWWSLDRSSAGLWNPCIYNGLIGIRLEPTLPPHAPPMWVLGRHWDGGFTLEWWRFRATSPAIHRYCVPIWMLVALFAVLSGYAWRLDARARRRTRLNLCAMCHYDRTGLAPGAACPECGQKAVVSGP